MICNHAHQKLFSFIITCPNLLLSLSIPIHHPQETHVNLFDWHVVKLHHPVLRPIVWYNVKLPTALEPHNQHVIKLQPCPDLA
jgi:hypothetical protein